MVVAVNDEDEAEDIPPYAELLRDLGRPGDGAESEEEKAEEAASSEDEIMSASEAEGAEDDLALFNGRWMFKGEHMATINGRKFQWVDNTPDTPDLEIKPSRDGFVLDNFGQRCEAKLNEKGELVWNDNQVWTRMRANVICAGSRGTAKAGAVQPPKPKLSAKARGHAAFSKGEYVDAIRLLSEARREDPSDSIVVQLLELAKLSAWEAEGIPVMRLCNFQAAVDLVAEYKKRGAEAKVKGSTAFREKRFRDAVPFLTQALQADPHDTITQGLLEYSRMQEWEAQGVPVMRLGDYQSAMALVDEIAQVDEMTIGELKEWYVNKLGFPDEKDLTKAELSKFWTLVQVWRSWPLHELHQEIEQRGLSLRKISLGDEDEQRQQLSVQILYAERMDAWEAKGYEAKRVGDPFMMCEVVKYYEEVDRQSMEELLEYYSSLDLPRETRLTREELAGLAKKIHFWMSLPLPELRRECRKYGIASADKSLPRTGTPEQIDDQQVQLVNTLLNELLIEERMAAWEKAGCYQAKHVGKDMVQQVVNRHYEIDQMSFEDLTEWYTSLNFPLDKHLTKDDISGVHKKVCIWQVLPLPELLEECKSKRLDVADVEQNGDNDDKRLGLLNALLFDDRMEYFEARGYGARRVGNITLAMDLVREIDRIDSMSLEDLKQWYGGLEFPEESDMTKKELADFCKKIRIWQCVPLGDLQKECAKLKLPITVMQTESEQYRLSLLDKLMVEDRKACWNAKGFAAYRVAIFEDLLQIVRAYEGYVRMSTEEPEEFKKRYSELALPEAPGMQHRDRLRNLKTLLNWESLPMRELQTECKERGLPYSQGLPIHNLADRREALVQRLRMDMQVNYVFTKEKPTFKPVRTDVGLPAELATPESKEEDPTPQRSAPRSGSARGRASASSHSGTASCESLPALARGDVEAGSGGGSPAVHRRETMDWYEEEEDKEPSTGGVVRSLLVPEAEEFPEQPREEVAASEPTPAVSSRLPVPRPLGPTSLPLRPQGVVRQLDFPGSPSRGDGAETAGASPSSEPARKAEKSPAHAPSPAKGGSGDSASARLLAWAAAGKRREAALLRQLVEALGDEEDLGVADVPEEPAECTEFLEELGFKSPEETAQVQRAISEFRAETLRPKPRLASRSPAAQLTGAE